MACSVVSLTPAIATDWLFVYTKKCNTHRKRERERERKGERGRERDLHLCIRVELPDNFFSYRLNPRWKGRRGGEKTREDGHSGTSLNISREECLLRERRSTILSLLRRAPFRTIPKIEKSISRVMLSRL